MWLLGCLWALSLLLLSIQDLLLLIILQWLRRYLPRSTRAKKKWFSLSLVIVGYILVKLIRWSLLELVFAAFSTLLEASDAWPEVLVLIRGGSLPGLCLLLLLRHHQFGCKGLWLAWTLINVGLAVGAMTSPVQMRSVLGREMIWHILLVRAFNQLHPWGWLLKHLLKRAVARDLLCLLLLGCMVNPICIVCQTCEAGRPDNLGTALVLDHTLLAVQLF